MVAAYHPHFICPACYGDRFRVLPVLNGDDRAVIICRCGWEVAIDLRTVTASQPGCKDHQADSVYWVLPAELDRIRSLALCDTCGTVIGWAYGEKARTL